ncbi:MAG: ribosome hibernation-promoting factor, HPF/YfiA family [Candidatus Zipacnadales bacterium]
MRIEFTGRNMTLPEAFEKYAEKKLARLNRLADCVGIVRLVVAEQRGRKDVEITADLDGTLIRAEFKGPDERTSFDAALEKLERQVRKFKDRFHRRRRGAQPRFEEETELSTELVDEALSDASEPNLPRIARTKTVTLKPMAPEEAALQMELLGHDFFLFRNANTDLVSVVYRRHDDGYGLLECEA